MYSSALKPVHNTVGAGFACAGLLPVERGLNPILPQFCDWKHDLVRCIVNLLFSPNVHNPLYFLVLVHIVVLE